MFFDVIQVQRHSGYSVLFIEIHSPIMGSFLFISWPKNLTRATVRKDGAHRRAWGTQHLCPHWTQPLLSYSNCQLSLSIPYLQPPKRSCPKVPSPMPQCRADCWCPVSRRLCMGNDSCCGSSILSCLPFPVVSVPYVDALLKAKNSLMLVTLTRQESLN